MRRLPQALAARHGPCDVDRVYGALEGMGWIEQGYIPSWDDRGGRGSFE
jgi:hypothetical protein